MLGKPVAYTTLGELVRTEPPAAMIATVGSYTLTGQVISTRLARAILPDAGSYSLTGFDVEFPLSLSPVSYYRVFLVGSTSSQIRNFRMAQNFQMTAGDFKILVVTVRNSIGNVVNITNATIKWQAARSLGKGPVISKTMLNGVTLSDPVNGVFTVQLDHADTINLSGVYYHEAELTDASGFKSTVLIGKMKINKQLIV